MEREQKRKGKEKKGKGRPEKQKRKGKQNLNRSQTKTSVKESKAQSCFEEAGNKKRRVCDMARSLTICDSEQTSDEDDAVCPECRKIFANDADGFWKCL